MSLPTTTISSNITLDNAVLPSEGRMILSAELERFRPRRQAQEERPMSIQSAETGGSRKASSLKNSELLSLPTNSDSDITKNSHCNPHAFYTMCPIVIIFT